MEAIKYQREKLERDEAHEKENRRAEISARTEELAFQKERFALEQEMAKLRDDRSHDMEVKRMKADSGVKAVGAIVHIKNLFPEMSAAEAKQYYKDLLD